jgi:hypothetical protein
LTQLLFSEQWRLFISDIQYDITIEGGDDITHCLSNTANSVEQSLLQLSTVKAAQVSMRGSREYTSPRNAVLIMVSVVEQGNTPASSFLRQLSKVASIGAFVTGTAFFASVQLLALPMAIMVVTLVVAAAIFGRAIATWIVMGVDKCEPMLHVVCNSKNEACQIIAKILTLDEHVDFDANMRNVQVEIKGHVFVGCRRVGQRSGWYVRLMGIMAHPFDLRRVSTKEPCIQEASSSDGSTLGKAHVL